MPTDAQGRTISDDGQWWWDGGAWQPVKKGFFDTLADSVDDVVKKVEGSQATSGASSAATARSETSAPTMASASAAAPAPAPEPAPAPVAAAPAPAPVAAAPAPPAIPSADLLAYLGALRGAGVVSDAEFESIRRRIPGQA
jgi:hypothetical protein